MKYAIIGTGAIGGYYGAMLARAGHEVHFLLHTDYDFVKQNGLKVRSPKGDFALPHVLAHSSVQTIPSCDVVVVALKTTHQHLLAQLLPPLINEQTLVLLIQNGIGVEQDVAEMLPQAQLAAGMAFICAAKNEPGVVDHLDLGLLQVACYNAHEQRVAAMVEEMNQAELKAKMVDYQEARWRKALWNMPFNGLSVALNAQTNELVNNPHTCQLLREMMQEVLNAAQAMGVKELSMDDAESLIQMTKSMKPYSPSMKLDWENHRPMELKYLYTRPIEIAAEKGVNMSHMRMLEAQLHFMEAQRA